MSAPVLYANPFSQPSNAVRLLIAVTQINVNVQFVHDLKAPEYLLINPLGQVPALVDGDVTVLESAAIMIYLVEKFKLPSHWIGNTIQDRARVNEYLHHHHTHLRKGAAAFYKTYFGAEHDHPDVDAELAMIESSIKHFETHFLAGNRKFVGGDEISIADLQVGVAQNDLRTILN